MGVKFQQQVFNRSLKNVEKTNKQLIEVYNETLDKINKQIAILKIQIEKGLFAEARARRIVRLNRFIEKIKKDLVTLKARQNILIRDGFLENYANAYYGYGYDIERTLNTQILNKVNFDYTLGYRQLNFPYVRDLIFNEQIANQVFGLGLAERAREEVLRIQARIRREITAATLEGIGPREVAKRLSNIDEIFEQNLSHSFTVARTEMLRGHNMGSFDAISTAEDAGVKGNKIWDATLDGFTRPTHRQMDTASRKGEQPNKDGFFVFPDGSMCQFPVDPRLSAKESINCRCSLNYFPYGLTPNKRGSRLSNGDWEEVNGKLTYEKWAKTLEGKRSIKAASEYRRRRNNRLAKLRRQKKKRPVIENVKKRLESLKA